MSGAAGGRREWWAVTPRGSIPRRACTESPLAWWPMAPCPRRASKASWPTHGNAFFSIRGSRRRSWHRAVCGFRVIPHDNHRPDPSSESLHSDSHHASPISVPEPSPWLMGLAEIADAGWGAFRRSRGCWIWSQSQGHLGHCPSHWIGELASLVLLYGTSSWHAQAAVDGIVPSSHTANTASGLDPNANLLAANPRRSHPVGYDVVTRFGDGGAWPIVS